MAHTDTTVNTLKINRGTYANIQSNLSSIGENELIITTDKGTPVPTTSDSGKVISVNSSGEYELTTPSAGTTYSAGTGISIASNTISNTGVAYLTTAPSSANTSGDLKFVVLDSEPSTKYDGYFYIITEPAGYEVEITMAGSADFENYFIVDDYTVNNHNVYIESANILEQDDTNALDVNTTVQTTTGKLLLVMYGVSPAASTNNSTETGTIQCIGCAGAQASGSGDLESCADLYIDNVRYGQSGYMQMVAFSYTIGSDGTISISGIDWDF